jgi:hypothetical protein
VGVITGGNSCEDEEVIGVVMGGNVGEDKEGTGMEGVGARVTSDGNVCGIVGGARVAPVMEDIDGCGGKIAADSVPVAGGARTIVDKGDGP